MSFYFISYKPYRQFNWVTLVWAYCSYLCSTGTRRGGQIWMHDFRTSSVTPVKHEHSY